MAMKMPVSVHWRDQKWSAAAGTGEPVVAGQQVLDVAGDADPGGDEHDQVVADAFQVGDQVRGQDHAAAVFGDEFHQALQELPPGQGVEAGHGFIQDEQIRSFRDGQGQRELGALPAGQFPGLLGRVEAESGDPVVGQLPIPAGVGVGSEPQVVGDRQARIGGGVLGDEAHLGQLCGIRGRVAAEDRDAARPGGMARVQSDNAWRRP
jgi:hypothetical protein